MIFISQHTGGNYEPYADDLKKSLEAHGLDHAVHLFESHGDWNKNNNQKPRFILEMLEKHSMPVVWLDADCEVCKKPELILGLAERKIDFASYNWYADDDNVLTKGSNPLHAYNPHLHAISGGVLYIDYNDFMLRFVDLWRDLCECRPDIVDDHFLCGLLYMRRFGGKKNLNCEWLPKAYNRMGVLWPDVDPVIDHKCGCGNIYDGERKQ